MKKWFYLGSFLAALLFLAWILGLARAHPPASASGFRTSDYRTRISHPIQRLRTSLTEAGATAASPTPQEDVPALLPETRESLLLRTACASEVLSAFTGPEGCKKDAEGLRSRMKARIEKLEREGFRLDSDRCVATDPDGETTDLASMPESLVGVMRLIGEQAASFSFGKIREKRALARLNLVAICSVAKAMDYWDAHPAEIPPPDRIEDYLYFDIESGRPRESYVAGAFLRALAAWQRMQGADGGG